MFNILQRNNDLTEFFWPLFYYVKHSILTYHQIPLWNNLFFAGTPLITDPQNPVWYILNIIFLFVNINTGIIISLTIHLALSLIASYILLKSIGLKNRVSILTSIVYSLSPLYFSFLEAGHYGLIICWAWLPVLALSVYKLSSSPKIRYIVLFVLAGSSLYFNHILTAAIAISAATLYLVYKKKFRWLLAALASLSIVILPVFIIQYPWQAESTRNMLINFPETFPLWQGKMEFFKTLFFFNPATEKAITFGVIPTITAIIGFSKLDRKRKITLLVFATLIVLIAMNNISPVFGTITKIKFFDLMRVMIRPWFLVYFCLIYLFALGLSSVKKPLAMILGICSIVELLTIASMYLAKPIGNRSFAPLSVYQYVSSNTEVYKVFCTTRCLSQKEAAIYNLHLADGYGTLQQANYFEAGKQIGQYYWNRYTLEIPPSSIYLFNELQPDARTLAAYSVKYVVSPHTLKDTNFVLVYSSDDFLVYLNKVYKSLNYEIYTPNQIRIRIDSSNTKTLSVPEIYSYGWKAFANSQELRIHENHDHTLEVEIPEGVKSVDLYYQIVLPGFSGN